MTSIVGVTALQEFRKFKGMEESIIAGGFCRDSLMGASFKDLDIFVPCTSQEDFRRKIEQHLKVIKPAEEFLEYVPDSEIDAWINNWEKKNFPKTVFSYLNLSYQGDSNSYKIVNLKPTAPVFDTEMGNFTGLKFTDNEYMIDEFFVGKYDCQFMGFLDVDICGYKDTSLKTFEGTVDAFGPRLVERFNYNIDKVYFDGQETVTTTAFDRDAKYMEATLCKLDSVTDLPYAMKKFERLKTKYPKLRFKSSCLELIGEKKESANNTIKKKSWNKYEFATRGTTGNGIGGLTDTTFL